MPSVPAADRAAERAEDVDIPAASAIGRWICRAGGPRPTLLRFAAMAAEHTGTAFLKHRRSGGGVQP